MLLPCEVAIKCVLPVVRAAVAKELINKYNLKQVEAAKLLGISQPAISLYYRNIRGKAIDLKGDMEVETLIGKLAASLIKDALSPREFIQLFCGICIKARSKGLLCRAHQALDPSIEIQKCRLCINNNFKCT
ncbi:MAG: hypothetical protein QXZ25_04415 [Candidatus Bathyarchaeia archaeon]